MALDESNGYMFPPTQGAKKKGKKKSQEKSDSKKKQEMPERIE